MGMTLQELLRKKRKENGWTNKKVGEMIGTHHSLISAYETGRRRPSLRCLKKLAELYELPYLELLKMREEQKSGDEYLTQKKLYAAERKIEKYEDSLHMIRSLAKKNGTMQEIKEITTDVLFESRGL